MTPHRRTGPAAQPGRNTACTEGRGSDGRAADSRPLPAAGLSAAAEGMVRERVIPAGARSLPGPGDRRSTENRAGGC